MCSIVALFGSSHFIVFACRYIYTLQRFLLKRYRYLESKKQRGFNFKAITVNGNDEASLQNEVSFYKSCHSQVTAFWASFRVLQTQTIFLCRFIAEYNRFCWPLLSALFAQCYLLYVISFQKSGLFSPLSRIFFYLAIAQCNTAVFYLCKVATAVGRLNVNIELSERKIFQSFRNGQCHLRTFKADARGSGLGGSVVKVCKITKFFVCY